jgi:diguanylate cyclase (GGDEF)-like protein/PAS domain S-box-containing protein
MELTKANIQLEQEIIARKQVEEDLWLKVQLLDHIPDSIFVHDPDGNFYYLNAAAWKSRGYTREELMGMNLHELDTPEYGKLIETRVRELMEKGAYIFESAHMRKDGSVMPVEVSTHLVESGGKKLILSVARDITERKLSEKNILENEKRYHLLFNNMLEGFALCRMLYENNQPHDFIYLDVNTAFEKLTGLRNVVGKKVSELIPGVRDSNPELFDIYGRVVSSGVPERFETYVAALKIWFSIAVYSTESTYFVAVFDNITERKQLEHALLRKNAMYAVLSATNSAIVYMQNRQELFDEVCRVAMELGGFCLAWMGLLNESDRCITPVAMAGDAGNLVELIVAHYCEELAGECSSIGTAILENHHVLSNDFINDTSNAPWHATAKRYGIRSSLSLPIRGGGIRGAFMVYATEQDYFQQDAIDLLLEMASDVSFALDKIQATEQHRQDEAQLRLHAQVFDKSSEGMLISDADNNILMVNQSFTDTTGYTLKEVKGKNPSILKSGRQEHDFYVQMWKTLLTQGFWQGEIWERNKNGELFPVWSSINMVKDGSGKVANYFAVYSDLSQKNALKQLRHLQRHDALTDLPNRLLLEDRVTEAIIHAHQHDRYVAVLFINLNHFHAINDLLGHAAGDQVLQAVADRLSANAGEQATVSHFSGDTFVVVLPDINHPGEINLIAELLLGVVAEPLSIAQQDIELTGRIGIAVYPNDGKDFAELTKNADLAVLQAKEDGRNSYCYFTPSMNEHSTQILTIRRELRHALKNNWFVLHYQPQVNILSGKTIGCEALIRMRHPERGLIAPLEFISVAEETGLIIPIGEWVIREACNQMKRWYDEGHTDLVMSVNVSPLQLRQPNLITVIRQILDESGLAPKYLELEFTESALMKNIAPTLELMKNLKDIGLRLAIDDFGTGYSSLNYLKQFTVDKLKIDQSFVQNIAHDPNDASIVQAIIAIARSMGISTIAEGVETEAQLGYLRSLHCNEIQGFYYRRAVPPDEFFALFQHEHEVVQAQSANTLLLVDDEENVLIALKRILHRDGYHILTAANAEQALELLAKNNICVVVSDQRMPGMSGVELLRRVKLMYPDVVRMILSGYTEVGTLTDAINKGEIYQFITKPWENETVIASIREAFLRYEILKRNGR